MLIPFPTSSGCGTRSRAPTSARSSRITGCRQQVIAAQTSQQYDSLLVARKHRQVLIEGRELSADFLKRTQARYNAGTAAKLDVIKAQVDVAQADNDLIANELDIANAQAALNRASAASSARRSRRWIPWRCRRALPDSQTIEQTALAEPAGADAARERAAGRERDDELAPRVLDSGFHPRRLARLHAARLAAVLDRDRAPDSALLLAARQGEIAESRYRERELAASYRDLRAQVTQDVRSAYATASTSLRQVLFLRDELVPAAREAFRVASVSYRSAGRRRSRCSTRGGRCSTREDQLADALASANIARADLERALGVPLSPDVKPMIFSPSLRVGSRLLAVSPPPARATARSGRPTPRAAPRARSR